MYQSCSVLSSVHGVCLCGLVFYNLRARGHLSSLRVAIIVYNILWRIACLRIMISWARNGHPPGCIRRIVSTRSRHLDVRRYPRMLWIDTRARTTTTPPHATHHHTTTPLHKHTPHTAYRHTTKPHHYTSTHHTPHHTILHRTIHHCTAHCTPHTAHTVACPVAGVGRDDLRQVQGLGPQTDGRDRGQGEGDRGL